MENTVVGEGSLYRLGIEREPSEADGLSSSESNSKRFVWRRSLSSSFNQLQTRKNGGGIDCGIPRHLVNLDEKYLRHCLELIHISASKAATGKISVNFSSRVMGILAGGSNVAEAKGEETFDTARFVFECPLVEGVGSVAIRPAGQGIVGSVMGSKSMVNLLKSPLCRQFGGSDNDVNSRRTNFEDDKAVTCYNFMSSPGGSCILSSPQQVRDARISENYKVGYGSLDRRLASTPSTNWTCSDQSSAASASVSHGMLQCTWRDGIPHFVFSVDNEREVYVANLSTADSAEGKAPNYVYLLYSTKGGQKTHEISVVQSHLVGKIEASTSFTIGPNNSKVKETEFILYGNNENHVREMPISSPRKPKALSKKVVDVFRTSHAYKQKAISKFNGSGPTLEHCSWEPLQDTSNIYDELGEVDLLQKHLPPNCELAAIVVKDHIPDNRQREVGGWGLKFLKNTGTRQTIDSVEALVTSDQCCAKDSSDCSTSIDILVPAGLHGGPRTRHGGPSSLIERWKCGCCDCGGWDMGCPLTVFNTRPSVDCTDTKGECKTFDIFVKDSEQIAPTLKMVNVHDGLYLINFQSVLSALQCFSIAVALMHTRSPNLYRN